LGLGISPKGLEPKAAQAAFSTRMRIAKITAFIKLKISAIFQAPKTSGKTAISRATIT